MGNEAEAYTGLTRQLQFDAVLLECINTLHSEEDINQAINRLLGIMADFHAADRAYIFEFDWNTSLMHNTYEWCREGVEPEIDDLQNLDISIIDRWLQQFEEKGEFYISSLDSEIDKNSDEYQILAMQGIGSLMAAPLKSGGRLVGMVGVDNPKKNTHTLVLMRSVAAFVVNDIQKRVTIEQQMISAIASIYRFMHLFNLVEDTQREIHSNREVRRFINQGGNASEQILQAMEELTAEEHVEEVLEFSNLQTLDERMRDSDVISHEFLAKSGHWCRANFIVVSRGEEGKIEQILHAVQYIDREKRRELEYQRALKQALENQNEIYSEMLQMQSGGVIAISVATGDILMINESALKMFGYQSRDEFDGKISTLDGHIELGDMEDWTRHFDELTGDGPYPYEFTIGSGEECRYILSNSKMAALANGEQIIILTLTDVTEKEKMEQELRIMSQTDSLTRISNRGSGEQQIEEMLAEDIEGMFCLFDVDNFKAVNDCFGHIVGDKVLVEIAGCLKKSFRDGDVVMRLGGDEFAVFAVGVESEAEGERYIRNLFENVEKVRIEEMDRQGISVSLGAVLRRRNSTSDFDVLYQRADSAMYICKRNEGSYFQFYSE